MGGGVSLGSFSGSALTEALKLLIIFGKTAKSKESNQELYDKVIVDGMSGASAGAVALTIMLRCLIDYKSMLLIWKPIDKNNPNQDENHHKINRISFLKKALISDYFLDEISFENLSREKKDQLIALELAQNIQREIWVNDLNIDKLYGSKKNHPYNYNLNDSFGLLERKHMEGLIEEYLLKSKVDLGNIKVLDKNRVIFACSLTNLLPIAINQNIERSNSLKQNVANSTGLFNHAEVRVIDYVFSDDIQKKKPSDNRWLKFQASNNPDKNELIFDIGNNKSWKTIAASALACAAFPVAFEPLLLRRFKKEFDSNDGINGKDSTGWPKRFVELSTAIKELKKEDQNSYFNDKKGSRIDYDSFIFPYIDGGTFNNEPIKEAFRIASFQDFAAEDQENRDRLVLFVDPIVRKEQSPSFNVDSFSPIKGFNPIQPNSEKSKFVGAVGSLLGLLVNQGRAKEAVKITGVEESLSLRETMFEYLEGNENIKLTPKICIRAFKKISKQLNDNIISIGTRSPVEYFIEQINKESNGNWEGISFKQLRQDAKKIDEFLLNLSPEELEDLDIDNIYNRFGIKDKEGSIKIFIKCVFQVIVDISLDTAGKNENAVNAAILPINKNNQIIDLPGTEVQAFAGFASLASKNYAFEYGRLSALKSLRADEGFRVEGGPYLTDNVLGDLDRITTKLNNKIKDTEFFDKSNNYKQVLKTQLFKPSIERIKVILDITHPKVLNFFLKIPLPLIVSSVLPLYGLYKTIRKPFKSAKGNLNDALDTISSSVDKVFNTPITISIISKPLKRNLYQRLFKKESINILIKHTSGSDKKIKGHIKKINDTGYVFITLKLYLFRDSDNASVNSKSQMKLTTNKNVKLFILSEPEIDKPNTKDEYHNLDPNLNPNEWMNQLRSSLPPGVISLNFNDQKIDLKENYINNTSQSLYHSLKSIEYHVNPMLQIDLTKDTGWYFKENTKSFDEN